MFTNVVTKEGKTLQKSGLSAESGAKYIKADSAGRTKWGLNETKGCSY